MDPAATRAPIYLALILSALAAAASMQWNTDWSGVGQGLSVPGFEADAIAQAETDGAIRQVSVPP